MAPVNKVLRSINIPDGGRCVDIFTRPDDTWDVSLLVSVG